MIEVEVQVFVPSARALPEADRSFAAREQEANYVGTNPAACFEYPHLRLYTPARTFGVSSRAMAAGVVWDEIRLMIGFGASLRRGRLFAAALLLALASVSAHGARGPESSLVRETVHSPALEGNLLRDSPDRSVFVYLPRSYGTSGLRRFPVVYLLHGVGDSNADWLSGQYQGMNLQTSLDLLISSGKVREMIVVMPDASNAYQSCFYTNSSVTGNWEDFVVEDLVRFVDGKYRTIAEPAGRGVAGHSMGGYAALKLAMKHPDLFGSVYALSPCCFEWAADLSASNPLWAKTIRLQTITSEEEKEFYPKLFVALGTAWSPNPRRAPFLVDLPFELADGKVQPSEPAYSEWSANLLLPMAPQYRTNLAKLRAVGIDYGRKDQFAHIPLGCEAFSRFLAANGIDHRIEAYEGDHFDHVRERIETKLLPFFSEVFPRQESRANPAPSRN